MTTALWKTKKAIACPVCCKTFVPNSPKQKYCSDKCSRIMRPSNTVHRRQTVAEKKAISRDRFEENIKHQDLDELERAREARINIGPQPATCTHCPCYVHKGGSVDPCSHPRLPFSLIGIAARNVRMQCKCPWGLKVIK